MENIKNMLLMTFILITCGNISILNTIDQIKYIIFYLFYLFIFIFLNVASRRFKMTYVTVFIISVLDSTDTEPLNRVRLLESKSPIRY